MRHSSVELGSRRKVGARGVGDSSTGGASSGSSTGGCNEAGKAGGRGAGSSGRHQAVPIRLSLHSEPYHLRPQPDCRADSCVAVTANCSQQLDNSEPREATTTHRGSRSSTRRPCHEASPTKSALLMERSPPAAINEAPSGYLIHWIVECL